jgi:excisionase family DNA binding protein
MQEKIKGKRPESAKARPSAEKDFLTPQDLAKATGIGLVSIYEILRAGELPVLRIGKRFYVPEIAYRNWLAGLGRPAA